MLPHKQISYRAPRTLARLLLIPLLLATSAIQPHDAFKHTVGTPTALALSAGVLLSSVVGVGCTTSRANKADKVLHTFKDLTESERLLLAKTIRSAKGWRGFWIALGIVSAGMTATSAKLWYDNYKEAAAEQLPTPATPPTTITTTANTDIPAESTILPTNLAVCRSVFEAWKVIKKPINGHTSVPATPAGGSPVSSRVLTDNGHRAPAPPPLPGPAVRAETATTAAAPKSKPAGPPTAPHRRPRRQSAAVVSIHLPPRIGSPRDAAPRRPVPGLDLSNILSGDGSLHSQSARDLRSRIGADTRPQSARAVMCTSASAPQLVSAPEPTSSTLRQPQRRRRHQRPAPRHAPSDEYVGADGAIYVRPAVRLTAWGEEPGEEVSSTHSTSVPQTAIGTAGGPTMRRPHSHFNRPPQQQPITLEPEDGDEASIAGPVSLPATPASGTPQLTPRAQAIADRLSDEVVRRQMDAFYRQQHDAPRVHFEQPRAPIHLYEPSTTGADNHIAEEARDYTRGGPSSIVLPPFPEAAGARATAVLTYIQDAQDQASTAAAMVQQEASHQFENPEDQTFYADLIQGIAQHYGVVSELIPNGHRPADATRYASLPGYAPQVLGVDTNSPPRRREPALFAPLTPPDIEPNPLAVSTLPTDEPVSVLEALAASPLEPQGDPRDEKGGMIFAPPRSIGYPAFQRRPTPQELWLAQQPAPATLAELGDDDRVAIEAREKHHLSARSVVVPDLSYRSPVRPSPKREARPSRRRSGASRRIAAPGHDRENPYARQRRVLPATGRAAVVGTGRRRR